MKNHGSVKLVPIGKIRPVSLCIDPELLRKLWGYTIACDWEISGLGEAAVDEETGAITIGEPFHILDQEGSAGSTHLDQEAVGKLLSSYVREGKSPKRLRFWYHSHCDMGTFFSGTDDTNIRSLHKYTPWQISGVFVRRGEVLWRVTTPEGNQIEWEQTITLPKPTNAELDALKPEITAKVRHTKWWSPLAGGWRKGFRTKSRWKSTKGQSSYHYGGSHFGY